jgi:hypothetical protein
MADASTVTNGSARRALVFFYGLFMDHTLLEAKGFAPADVELGSITGHSLRIGRRATLVPESGGRVYGAVMTLQLAAVPGAGPSHLPSAGGPRRPGRRRADGGLVLDCP